MLLGDDWEEVSTTMRYSYLVNLGGWWISLTGGSCTLLVILEFLLLGTIESRVRCKTRDFLRMTGGCSNPKWTMTRRITTTQICRM
jgi:uncharacterized membrane protein